MASSIHLYTDHDSHGNAIFSKIVPSNPHNIQMPIGTIGIVYSNSEICPNVLNTGDLRETQTVRLHGQPDGRQTPSNGMSAALVDFAP